LRGFRLTDGFFLPFWQVLQKLRGCSTTQLYCEILRACCLGLAETADAPSSELRWAVFTFLKGLLV